MGVELETLSLLGIVVEAGEKLPCGGQLGGIEQGEIQDVTLFVPFADLGAGQRARRRIGRLDELSVDGQFFEAAVVDTRGRGAHGF
ncbi:MAG: hypothetical protein EXS18_03680 [Verrucomicrobiae bacterium]|nr:hypothetical protein [Verrucomicrobiae bacterium]